MRISKESIAKHVFGSRVKRLILNFLYSNQESVSERELSRIIGVTHTAVNKAMQQLLDLNIVKGRTIGNSLVWELNKSSFAYPYVISFIEAGKISPLDYIKKSLKNSISLIDKVVCIIEDDPTYITEAYIIGSVADGTAKPESDIDVLIISKRSKEKSFLKSLLQDTIGMRILEETGNKVSFHIYDVIALEKNKPSWLFDAIKRGIKVY